MPYYAEAQLAQMLMQFRPPRVAAGFQPSHLSDLSLWLKADSIGGLVDADPVATWTDSSANAHALAQATPSKKPTYKVNIINGWPVVRFDGTDDFLSCVSHASLQFTTDLTAFAVVKPGASFSNDTIVSKGPNSSDPDYLWQIDRSGANATVQSLYDSTAWRDGASGGAAYSVSQILHMRVTGGGGTFYKNGTSAGTVSPSTFPSTTNAFYIASQADTVPANPWNQDIAEIILYKAGLTAAQHNQVLGYLSAKYGISVATVT